MHVPKRSGECSRRHGQSVFAWPGARNKMAPSISVLWREVLRRQNVRNPIFYGP